MNYAKRKHTFFISLNANRPIQTSPFTIHCSGPKQTNKKQQKDYEENNSKIKSELSKGLNLRKDRKTNTLNEVMECFLKTGKEN